MKTTIKILILFFVLGLVNLSSAQNPKFERDSNGINLENFDLTKKELRKSYKQANHYLEIEKVDEALRLFAKLAINDPSNSNFIYHVGLCYYQKGNYPAAKDFFEIASECTSKRYRDNALERNAPLEVLDYLEEMNKNFGNNK